MTRVQAFIVSHEDGIYKVEARAEGVETPFLFSIFAKSDTDAAMEAIRRVEDFNDLIAQNTRTN